MQNSIFCTAPFTTLRIESSLQSNQVSFKPGCIYRLQHDSPTLEHFVSGPEMTALRNNKLNGNVASPGCIGCSQNESIGVDSIRQQLMHKPWASDKFGIKLLDVFFSNTCNLGCYMCGTDISSYIVTERNAAGLTNIPLQVQDNTDLALDTIDQLPVLESVSFIGGEFFVFKKNLVLLDKIIERGLECRIVTNASVLTPALLEKLQQVKKLELQISMDGVHDTYTFMRFPSDWSTFSANVDILRHSLPHAEINLRYVTQVLNIANLFDTLDWANKQRLSINTCGLSSPNSQGLNWSILHPEEKASLVDFLSANKNSYRLTKDQKHMINSYIDGVNLMPFDQQDRNAGVKLIAGLTRYRKISPDTIAQILCLFPKLAQDIVHGQNKFDFSRKPVYNIRDETSNHCNTR